MKTLVFFLSLILSVLTSCRSEYERQQEKAMDYAEAYSHLSIRSHEDRYSDSTYYYLKIVDSLRILILDEKYKK